MKLLCLNVALFEENNEKLFNFLNNQEFHFLCLQEVTRRVDAKAKEEFVSKAIIDSATKELQYSFYTPGSVLRDFRYTDFHKQEKFEIEFGGFMEYGQYIKSKYPIFFGKGVFVQNVFTYVTDWNNWPEEDYRVLEVVDINIENDKKLRLMNYHGIWSKDKQGGELALNACKKIKEIALGVDYPTIICGDFNLFPDTKSMKVFDDEIINLSNEYNIQTTRPQFNELSGKERNVVDYILVNDGVKVSDFQVLDSEVSDHLPLVLDFEVV